MLVVFNHASMLWFGMTDMFSMVGSTSSFTHMIALTLSIFVVYSSVELSQIVQLNVTFPLSQGLQLVFV